MSRAFVVQIRNDLEPSIFHALDLKPNTSLLNPAYAAYQGQTSYFSAPFVDEPVTLVDVGGGAMSTVGDTYGMQALLMDRINMDGMALTAMQATAIADGMVARVSSGLSMTGVDFFFLVVDLFGFVDLTGSLGDIIDVLRVFSGEVYKLPAGTAVSTAGNVFSGVASGYFVTPPDSLRPPVAGGPGGTPSGVLPLFNAGAPPQASTSPRFLGAGVVSNVLATADSRHVNLRLLVDTPDLHRSCGSGALSLLKSSSFMYRNPSFTYGASGSATTLNGDPIPSTGTGAYQSPAIMVYNALGEII